MTIAQAAHSAAGWQLYSARMPFMQSTCLSVTDSQYV